MKHIYLKNIQSKSCRQRGFTLMEIAIVMLILSALVATMATNLWSRQDTMSIQQAVIFFNKDLPQAIANAKINGYGDCFKKSGGLSSTNWDDACTSGTSGDLKLALVSSGVEPNTLWSEVWTSTYSTGVIKITYPVASLSLDAQLNFQRKIRDEANKGGALIRHTTGTTALTPSLVDQCSELAADASAPVASLTVYISTR